MVKCVDVHQIIAHTGSECPAAVCVLLLLAAALFLFHLLLLMDLILPYMHAYRQTARRSLHQPARHGGSIARGRFRDGLPGLLGKCAGGRHMMAWRQSQNTPC